MMTVSFLYCKVLQCLSVGGWLTGSTFGATFLKLL